MFTGIVQATAGIAAIHDRAGLRTFTLDFPEGFCQDLGIGASVATDGVCLTVTEILSPTQANFDVMLQSLNITTLGSYAQGDRVNVERAAKDGDDLLGCFSFTAANAGGDEVVVKSGLFRAIAR